MPAMGLIATFSNFIQEIFGKNKNKILSDFRIGTTHVRIIALGVTLLQVDYKRQSCISLNVVIAN